MRAQRGRGGGDAGTRHLPQLRHSCRGASGLLSQGRPRAHQHTARSQPAPPEVGAVLPQPRSPAASCGLAPRAAAQPQLTARGRWQTCSGRASWVTGTPKSQILQGRPLSSADPQPARSGATRGTRPERTIPQQGLRPASSWGSANTQRAQDRHLPRLQSAQGRNTSAPAFHGTAQHQIPPNNGKITQKPIQAPGETCGGSSAPKPYLTRGAAGGGFTWQTPTKAFGFPRNFFFFSRPL